MGVAGVCIDEALVAKDRFEPIDDMDGSLCRKGAGARSDRLVFVRRLFLSTWCVASGVTLGKPPPKSLSSEASTGIVRRSGLSPGA
jgi:hypothetical protein